MVGILSLKGDRKEQMGVMGQGLVLMVFGMTVVYLFLWLMIVVVMLGLSVGSKLACEKFLSGQTLAILALGLCAFCVGTAGGVLMAKLMNVFSKKENRVNPLIGSAGVSAVPMAARVSNKVALADDPTNFVLMQAMGPNVSGVIGSAVVAGILYTLCR